jgi:hypothetical protein
VVPGSGGGNLPERTQFENVVGERLQYAAACCRFSKRGLSSVIDDVRVGLQTISELTAQMVSQGKFGRTGGPDAVVEMVRQRRKDAPGPNCRNTSKKPMTHRLPKSEGLQLRTGRRSVAERNRPSFEFWVLV